MTSTRPWSVIDTIANLGSPVRINGLKANGITDVCRYVSPTTGIGKVIYKAEVDALVAAGIGIVFNYERGAGDWRGGYNSGFQAGRWARNYVSGTGTTTVNGVTVPCFGLPTSVCIVYSIDTGVATSELGLAADCIRGFNDGAGGVQCAYGPWNVGEYLKARGLIKHFWQWKDGSRANTVHTNIRQNYPTPYNLGYTYDSNTPVTLDFGQYTGKPPDGGWPPYNPANHQYSLFPIAVKPQLNYGDGYAVAQEKRPPITYFNDVMYYECGQPTRTPTDSMFVFTGQSVDAVRNIHNFFDPNNTNPGLAAEAWYGVCGPETWKLTDQIATHFGQPRDAAPFSEPEDDKEE